MALIDSLVSYWKLDEASGNRSDSHGTNTLTDNNTVASATGKIGTAADFESANTEYLSCADNASLSTGDIDFTFSCWVKPESLVNFPVILVKGDTGSSASEYALYYDTSANALKFGVTSATYVEVSSGSALSTGTWYFIVCHHDSINNQVAISVNDGTLQTASKSDGVTDTTYPFQIGASVGQSLWWDGLIDEVGFWKRVLTSGERTSLYNGGSGLAYPFNASKSGLFLPRRTYFWKRRVA